MVCDLAERVAALEAMFAPKAKDTALCADVESFLARHDLPATKFGRMAAHDPRFVLDLRNGRTPRWETGLRVRAWMQGYDDANGGGV